MNGQDHFLVRTTTLEECKEKRHKKIYVECVGSVVTVDRSVKRKEVCLIGLSHALLNYILKLIVLVLLILGILLRNIPCVGVFLCGFISCVQRYSFVLFTASTECMDSRRKYTNITQC